MERIDDSKQMDDINIGFSSGAKSLKRKLRNRRSTYLRAEDGMGMWSDSSVMSNKKVGERK